MPPHAGLRLYACTACQLEAHIEGGPHSSTLRGNRTKGVPVCPACGVSSWLDPHSFTAHYRNWHVDPQLCSIGPHADPATTRVVLQPTVAVPVPSFVVIVIRELSLGLCPAHVPDVQARGLGDFAIART